MNSMQIERNVVLLIREWSTWAISYLEGERKWTRKKSRGYYRHFVQYYGTIASPLTQLLKLGAFKWTKEAQEAFLKLQNAMVTLPVLALPDFSLPFEIEINASGYGVGAMLVQGKRPIAYYNHTLAMRDRAKPVYEEN
ncbi:transposon Tf2-1 polyprotein isoform X1 [Cucumis melo var. makuwa]|uniref:Transposon Tf2-1 polyprotein isoform X1 n=1 Tax=Cucumis melo var. makuwa TaxID=1194695 RepID=A0A5D3C582_CUCMM|nr:transposon Tf2-1 polyprotein isoform X1 [Cucumis melo var. makuwa]